MYIMKRTEIVFISNGEKINGVLEDMELNKVLDLKTRELKKHRLILGKKYYNIDELESKKIEKLYKEILGKDIHKTRSFDIPIKDSAGYCYIDEEDYCSIVRKVFLDDYDMESIDYKYYIETKSIESESDVEFEIDEKTYKIIKNMNN